MFGLKVVTKAKELAFGDRNSAIRILTALFVLSYIKLCDYSCEAKSFSSSFSHICIMLLFSTTVWIPLARVKGVLILHELIGLKWWRLKYLFCYQFYRIYNIIEASIQNENRDLIKKINIEVNGHIVRKHSTEICAYPWYTSKCTPVTKKRTYP